MYSRCKSVLLPHLDYRSIIAYHGRAKAMKTCSDSKEDRLNEGHLSCKHAAFVTSDWEFVVATKVLFSILLSRKSWPLTFC